MAYKNLLLEIGTEEIPSRFLPDALETIVSYAEKEFETARIKHGRIGAYGTPRRIALTIRDVQENQEDKIMTYKGPTWESAFDANGNPTKAAIGFAKSKGVNYEELTHKEVDGVRYAFAVISEQGNPVQNLLPQILTNIMGQIVFPKNMYWLDPTIKFARPIRWIVALLDKEIVPFTYGGIESGRTTRGHRFMGSRSIDVADASEFMEKLYDNYVILDQEKRKQKMISGITALEKEIGGKVELDPELVDENLYLVEFPIPFYGSFDKKFLDIPEEVLTTSMKKHQKYFPVRSENGKLMPFFVGVSNNRATNMGVVREGNERVLRARLEDAAFFWAEDLKKPLAGCIEGLKSIVYQEKLGSLYDKIKATQKLAKYLCEKLGFLDEAKLVDRAALLSKCDLLTNMVYEFPELQGIMGREYALRNGEPERVAKAIYEQYLPKSAGDTVPSDIIGAILGIAERIFVIVNCHKVGLQPTGSQDPYALRRAARCINEIIWGVDLDVDIADLISQAGQNFEVPEKILEQSRSFFEQRLHVQLKEKGYEHDLVTLAISVVGRKPLQALHFLNVVNKVKNEEWFVDLVTAAVRVRNILSKAEEYSKDIAQELFQKNVENELFLEMNEMTPLVEDALERYDWDELMVLLSRLSPRITAFFDDVMIMDNDLDIRQNRLALLSRCNSIFKEVGDLGVLKN
ncbi:MULTISPECIES: glycine--tRNA ligase subunit beta [Aminobacterium]|jgi:glycyl-tRNA synthetase beta chain|uniref:glycine--tRNA ligase subunit beta n=1 Tax=Aminobacterium TaxID=81466 RepID=UPI002580656C|nr:glycine--tRNA ligase subunit beta [Aminobacterium sp. UBA4987]